MKQQLYNDCNFSHVFLSFFFLSLFLKIIWENVGLSRLFVYFVFLISSLRKAEQQQNKTKRTIRPALRKLAGQKKFLQSQKTLFLLCVLCHDHAKCKSLNCFFSFFFLPQKIAATDATAKLLIRIITAPGLRDRQTKMQQRIS